MKAEYIATIEKQLSWLRFDHRPYWQEDPWVDDMRIPLQTGDAFYVAPVICELIRRAAETLPETTLRAEMIPAITGWAWLPPGLQVPGDNRVTSRRCTTPQFDPSNQIRDRWGRGGRFVVDLQAYAVFLLAGYLAFSLGITIWVLLGGADR